MTTRLVAIIEEAFAVTIPVRRLFELPLLLT